MRLARPQLFLGLGILLMIFGVVAIFAMVVRIVEPSFALSFVSYGASFGGFVLGLLGIALR